ncbi:hypothetical protein MAH48_15130 [Anoxybacillus flavithermus]|nr:hypothetical protein [Anoxybacillus flavithermus]
MKSFASIVLCKRLRKSIKRKGEKEVDKTEKGAGDDQESEENVIIGFGIGVVAGIDSFPSGWRCERGGKF